MYEPASIFTIPSGRSCLHPVPRERTPVSSPLSDEWAVKQEHIMSVDKQSVVMVSFM